MPTDALSRMDHNTANKEQQWKGGVLGIVENAYPKPEEVIFEEVATFEWLSSKLIVTHLTQVLIEHSQTPPRYDRKGEKALGVEGLPWHLVRRKIHLPALSPKDKIGALCILHQ